MKPDISPEDWRRLAPILDEALDLPEDRQRRFVETACDGDPRLLQISFDILALGQGPTGILDTPALSTASPDFADLIVPQSTRAPGELAGKQIGPWRLVRELGSGGMGIVWLADRADGQFDQQAALKLLRMEPISVETVARFRRERQILARLEHPGIARLLDGGVTEDGLPWFAMEYIDGTSITRHCDLRRASVEARLRLFLVACDAVQYAHRKLVVHRDLKPSNILVTQDGRVKLLDFGIARLLAETDEETGPVTRTGLARMTPEYAAPEQVRGEDPTTATDVYSLGMILYELLTGRRPYTVSGHSPDQVARVVLGAQPAAPSKAVASPAGEADAGRDPGEIAAARATTADRLARLLRGDLDTIVLAALRKEPERRYPGPEALARDIERHLLGLPVSARPDTVGYRTRKFAARHRAAVAASALVLLSLVGGMAAATFQARAARREAARATAITEFLTSTFMVAGPEEGQGTRVTARDLLDQGARRVEIDLAGQPEILAEMRMILGDLYRQIDEFDRAAPLLEGGLGKKRALYGEHSEQVILARERFGNLLYERGDLEEARRYLEETLADGRRSLGAVHAANGRTISALAAVISDLGDYNEAARLHVEGLAISRAIFGQENRDVATDLYNLATVEWKAGRHDEAERHHRAALAMRRRVLGDRHQETAQSMQGFATLLADRGQYDEADRLLREALIQFKALFGDDHDWVAECLNSLANLEGARGNHREALRDARAALDIRRRALGEGHPKFVLQLNNFAVQRYLAGDYAEAKGAFEESARLWTRQYGGQDHPAVASAINNLGMALREEGDLAAARARVQEGLAIRRRLRGDRHEEISQSLRNLGLVLTDLGSFEESGRVLEESLRIAREVYPPSHPRTAEVLVGLGRLRLLQGRAGAAEPSLREGLAIRLEKMGEDTLQTAEARMYLGACLSMSGRMKESEEFLRAAVARLEAEHGPAGWQAAEARLHLADWLARSGRRDEAAAPARKALEVIRSQRGPGHWMTERARRQAERLQGR